MDVSSTKNEIQCSNENVVESPKSTLESSESNVEKFNPTVENTKSTVETLVSSTDKKSNSTVEKTFYEEDLLSSTSETLRNLGDNLFYDYAARRRVIIRWNDERHVFDINDLSQKIKNDALLLLHCSFALYVSLQAVQFFFV